MRPARPRPQAILDAEAPWPAPGSSPHQTAQVWSNLQCIVAPERERCRPGFAAAAHNAAARGWPVVTRRSGGLAVPHGPNVICLTLSWYGPEPPAATEAFCVLAEVVCAAARSLGADPQVREISDALCPGAWDIALAGRKFAGLAQRRGAPRADGCAGVVAHAAIFCGVNFAPAVTAINSYYADVGAGHRFSADALTNLVPSSEDWRARVALAGAARGAGFRSSLRPSPDPAPAAAMSELVTG